MSNQKPIRGSLFGGFNKKDVAGYIEELSRKSGEYRTENEQLKERCVELESCRQELENLRGQFDTVLAQYEEAKAELEQLRADKAQLADINASLASELAAAKEDAAVYQAAKERLAALEIEASRRSLEAEREARISAAKILNDAGNSVVEVQSALEGIRRDALRMKETLRSQLSSLENSIDDLTALSRSKQEFLGKYTQTSDN
ncbi:MAG: hypothetical protein PUB32_09055 [Clostridiales bacterium]|nr:hypothetical protein [Clostridiales bacterium]